jgi:hypothetical protein
MNSKEPRDAGLRIMITVEGECLLESKAGKDECWACPHGLGGRIMNESGGGIQER